MALPAETQLKYWGIAAVTLMVVLWFLGDVLLPFVLGGAIAYFLDPVADRLERLGLGRGLSVALISVGFAILFLVVMLLVVPTVTRQAIGLINAIPELIQQFRAFVDARLPGEIGPESPFATALSSLAGTIKERGLALLEGVLSSAVSLVNVLMLFFIVPVVAVYLLIDWDNLVAQIDDLLPRDHAPRIRRLAGEMDTVLSSFLRGQGTVVLVQGAFYSVALMAAGLNFALVIGMVSGLLSFIPFVGSITGFVLAVGMALFQFWGEWLHILLIAGIFVFGQVVEGNYLTPKLVGSSVGLHPVWLLLALSVFGALFGFVGLLVAVPLAALLGVVVRFLVSEYKDGRLYRGLAWNDPPDEAERAARDTAAE